MAREVHGREHTCPARECQTSHLTAVADIADAADASNA